MASGERSVLIVGEDLARVDAIVPQLRRLDLDVWRAVRASAASKVVHEAALDLVVVVLPFRQARDFLLLMRSPRSPCRHAAVLLVLDGDPAVNDELRRLANRDLPSNASPEELHHAVDLLLNVAPRIEVQTSLRMRLGGQPADRPRVARVENLSTSGMLLSAPEPLPVGAVFGFELDLPSQKDPVRGRAQVVRHTPATADRPAGLGASFLSLGGEGPARLKSAISRERAAAAGAPRPIDAGPSGPADLPAATSPADRARVAATSADDVAKVEQQLAELTPMLETMLRQGLLRRLGVAEWYVTGVELGLESLRAFSAILETVYRGHVSTKETSKRIADLAQVRERLAEVAKPQQAVQRRVDILLEIRPSLERLLRELGEENTAADQSSKTRQRGVVSQLTADIGRLLRSRRSLHELEGQLAELRRPHYALARGALRRRVAEISQQFRGYGSSLRLDLPQLLTRRQGRKEAMLAVEHEIERMDDWLATIHGKVYSPKFARLATGNHAVDFAADRLHPVLAETLAAGYEYLVRAYSAYRHALDAVGADSRLLDRAAGLAASIAGAPGPAVALVRQAPTSGARAGEPIRPRLAT